MSSTFDRLQTRANQLGYTLVKEGGEHDGDRYRYLIRPNADRESDDVDDDTVGGLFTGKSYCSSLREVKDAIEDIREDELSLRFHGTMTLDYGETEAKSVHFQCTVRGSSHALRMVSSTYDWKKRESDEQYRKWKEEDERRRWRREERARERKEKEKGDQE